ncbi:MAG: hypothetical protein D6686_00595 [Alphaproteobacteria bacterium]|nr:MAG: hypothetical protein D6686_00595 [Alphaproteobacteria bacterium]
MPPSQPERTGRRKARSLPGDSDPIREARRPPPRPRQARPTRIRLRVHGAGTRREGIAPLHMACAMRLTLLAPDIVEASPDGQQGPEVTLRHRLEGFSGGV